MVPGLVHRPKRANSTGDGRESLLETHQHKKLSEKQKNSRAFGMRPNISGLKASEVQVEEFTHFYLTNRQEKDKSEHPETNIQIIRHPRIQAASSE